MAKQDTPASEPKKAEERPKLDKHTPRQWAEALGMLVKADPRLPQQETHYRVEHAVADSLYGWSDHEYHYQAASDALLLTEDDYRKALAAAMAFPLEAPHAPAIAPNHADKFKGFKPKARNREERP